METYTKEKLAKTIFLLCIGELLRIGKPYLTAEEVKNELGFSPQRLFKHTSNEQFLQLLERKYAVQFLPIERNPHLRKFQVNIVGLLNILKNMKKEIR